MRRQHEHELLVEDNRNRGERNARSRSPRARSGAREISNPRTPTPDHVNDNRGKGQGKGFDPTPAESIAVAEATTDALEGTDNRQRDHTSGQDEQSDAEAIAPPPVDTTIGEEPVDKEDNDNIDNLPDFGGSPAEIKEETDEATAETNETMEQVDQDMTPADGDYNVVTGAVIAQNTTIDA